MNHGSHWECIVPNVEDSVARRVPELAQSLPAVGEPVPWPPRAKPPPGWSPDSVLYLSEANGALRHVVVIMVDQKAQRSGIAAAYPLAFSDRVHSVVIEKVVPDENGFEGCVEARAAELPISFYDPFFARNCGRYRPGSSARIRFGALGYRLRKSPGDAGSGLWPVEEWGPGEFSFDGAIESMREATLGEFRVMALRTWLMQDSKGEDLTIDILAGRHTLRDQFEPLVGDRMAGVLWLQGSIAD